MAVQKQTTIWTCRDGTRLRVCDMTDRHLHNAIAFFRRKGARFLADEISAAYSVLSGLQGEMAQFCCENDINRMEETDPDEFLEERSPLFSKLLLEAERRSELTQRQSRNEKLPAKPKPKRPAQGLLK